MLADILLLAGGLRFSSGTIHCPQGMRSWIGLILLFSLISGINATSTFTVVHLPDIEMRYGTGILRPGKADAAVPGYATYTGFPQPLGGSFHDPPTADVVVPLPNPLCGGCIPHPQSGFLRTEFANSGTWDTDDWTIAAVKFTATGTTAKVIIGAAGYDPSDCIC